MFINVSSLLTLRRELRQCWARSSLAKENPMATERSGDFSGSPGAQVRLQLHPLQEIQGVPWKHQFLVFLESLVSQVGLGGLGDPKKIDGLLRNDEEEDEYILNIHVSSVLSVAYNNPTS